MHEHCGRGTFSSSLSIRGCEAVSRCQRQSSPIKIQIAIYYLESSWSCLNLCKGPLSSCISAMRKPQKIPNMVAFYYLFTTKCLFKVLIPLCIFQWEKYKDGRFYFSDNLFSNMEVQTLFLETSPLKKTLSCTWLLIFSKSLKKKSEFLKMSLDFSWIRCIFFLPHRYFLHQRKYYSW